MRRQGIEEFVLERLIPELKADGYEVVRDPEKMRLPLFLNDYQPDLVAFRADKKVAYEVKLRSEKQGHSLQEISKLFEGHNDWEFRVIWLSKTDEISKLKPQTKPKIANFYQQALDLHGTGNNVAAFLLSWAVLEAAARRIFGNSLSKPQTPGRVIEHLASLGYLTPSEADELRSLALLRNKIIHGELDAEVTNASIGTMLRNLGAVIEATGKPSSKVA